MFPEAQKLDHDSVNIDTVLLQLSLSFNDRKSDISACFTAHKIDSNDVSLTHKEIMSHFLNGQRASYKCSEVSHRNVWSLVRMALPVTEDITANKLQTIAFVHTVR